jgi:hypothetical protein
LAALRESNLEQVLAPETVHLKESKKALVRVPTRVQRRDPMLVPGK